MKMLFTESRIAFINFGSKYGIYNIRIHALSFISEETLHASTVLHLEESLLYGQ